MQFRTLVLVPDGTTDFTGTVTRLMEPYDVERKVPPHKELVPAEEIEDVVTSCGLDANDLEAVMAELREESGFECFIERGKIYWMSTDNPLARWDGWRVHSLKDDIWPVPDIPQDYVPFAIVTPDGKWHDLHDQPNAGKDVNTALRARAKTLLENYPSHFAVALDCHR